MPVSLPVRGYESKLLLTPPLPEPAAPCWPWSPPTTGRARHRREHGVRRQLFEHHLPDRVRPPFSGRLSGRVSHSPRPVRSTAGGWWVAVRGRSPPTKSSSAIGPTGSVAPAHLLMDRGATAPVARRGRPTVGGVRRAQQALQLGGVSRRPGPRPIQLLHGGHGGGAADLGEGSRPHGVLLARDAPAGREARSCWAPAGTALRLTTRAAVLTGRARGSARAVPDVAQAEGSGLFPHHLQGPAQVDRLGD
jgi:hypothetical protein